MTELNYKAQRRSDINERVGRVLENNLEQRSWIRSILRRVLADPKQKEIEPEALLYEAFRLSLIAESALKEKQRQLIMGDRTGDIDEKEIEQIEKEHSMIIKIIRAKTEGEFDRFVNEAEIAEEREAASEDQKSPSNEEMTYVPRGERPSYIY